MDIRIEDNHGKSEHPQTMESSQHLNTHDTGDDQIRLEVGERRFTAHASMSTIESPYFESLLLARWRQAQADGAYFVNAEDDLFFYILRYLRSGALPVIHSTLAGHYYSRYHALLREAEYFGIERLVSRLRNREFETAMTAEHAVLDLKGFSERCRIYHSNVHLSWGKKRLYICPRHIPVHRGSP